MQTKTFLAVAIVLLVAGALPVASLHRKNMTLRAQLDAKRFVRSEPESRTPSKLLAPASAKNETPNGIVATRETANRLAQLRAEVVALEKKAVSQFAANPEATDAPAANRDPEVAMTKLEYLRNVGRVTPAGALQTLFWSVINADDRVLAQTISWDEKTRPKVQALIERLPEETRGRYPTPEALAGLYLSKFALEVSAIHIAETMRVDDANAVLTVKGLTGRDEHLPMRLGPEGWQLIAAESNFKALLGDLGRKE